MPEQLTKEQLALRAEFCAAYGLETKQIFFDANQAEPYFDFAGLSYLATELGDFTSIHTATLSAQRQSVTVSCSVVSARGFDRTATGSCVIGARLPNGVVTDERQAENVARARALRHALALAGFSVLRAHRLRQQGASLDALPPLTTHQQANKDIAAIHVLAKKLGWHEAEYRDKLELFTDARSCADMTPLQLREVVLILRDLAEMTPAERAERITFARGARWERQRQTAQQLAAA